MGFFLLNEYNKIILNEKVTIKKESDFSMKKNFCVKVFLGVVIAFVTITAIAITARLGVGSTSNSVLNLTPEDKRAMSYNLVTDESTVYYLDIVQEKT